MKILPALLFPNYNQLIGRYHESISIFDEVHIDFADGDFVDNLLPDVPSISALSGQTSIEAHLMVQKPQSWVEQALQDERFKRIIIHAEAEAEFETLLVEIRQKNRRAGVALNPSTPIEVIDPYVQYLDQVLVLLVEPGFNGSPFIGNAVSKIEEIKKKYPLLTVEADGGMSPKTIPLVQQARADRAAVGSYLHQGNMADRLAEIQASLSLSTSGEHA